MIFEVQAGSIEPRTMTVEEGWWMIRVRNGITTTALDVELEDSRNAKVALQRTTPLSANTAILVNLQPGRHVFKIRGKAGWEVEIQVKPRAR
jgi:hypothetical protein